MTKNVRLQNLRDFTVQIRTPDHEQIVGTGIAVSMEGEIVTCAHVVEAVLGVHPRDADEAEVGVYFPQAGGGETKARRATVKACFQQHDDDVVLLQLCGGPAPLAPEQIAVLGSADKSKGNGFRSYGYRRLDEYTAGYAYGTIHGPIESPQEQDNRLEPIELESQQIDRGMSGAAILDIERNLVVGLIAKTWFSGPSHKDRDTGWGVNSRVLMFPPFKRTFSDQPLPKRSVQPIRIDTEVYAQVVPAGVGMSLFGAPRSLKEFTGREAMLEKLNQDWADPECNLAGLIGFGGEGKTVLARKWMDDICESRDAQIPKPEGVFWWSFQDRPGIDEFFEKALTFISGGRLDARQISSTPTRAQIIGASLKAGHYLFILDGLDQMQYRQDDQLGLIRNPILGDFLKYFADPEQTSFCLITSRLPVIDLLSYTTYKQRTLRSLSLEEGRKLMQAMGVSGNVEQLNQAVKEWRGHALTLSLLSGYLAESFGGDLYFLDEIPSPAENEPYYEPVRRVLEQYDDELIAAERAFLLLLSAFRKPVGQYEMERIFRANTYAGAINKPVAALNETEYQALLKRMRAFRLVRHALTEEEAYTLHPLIKAHYSSRLDQCSMGQLEDLYNDIGNCYLALAGDVPEYPELDDLQPLFEAIHYYCKARVYQEAFDMMYEKVYQEKRFVLTHQLGAYEVAYELALKFFPDGDITQPALIDDSTSLKWILNEVGLCLMSLGRLREAVPFYERAVASVVEAEDWHNASISYRNLADLHISLGELGAAAEAADQALALAQRAENDDGKFNSLSWQAWINHLRGNITDASEGFKKAERLKCQIEYTVKKVIQAF